MTQKVLSFDFGGTKIAAGVVNRQGRLLQEVRIPALFHEGKKAVLNQLFDLGQTFLSQFPEITRIGVASAGPLDSEQGVLLDPTNFRDAKGTWGRVPLVEILKKKFKCAVFLENDAAASILAEHWIGSAKKYQNSMMLTLGTGLGTGIICNGQLVRGGQQMHPEAGHIIIRQGDRSAPCGCGNWGCAEAFLSGKNFTNRARIRIQGNLDTPLSAEEITDLARHHDPVALAAFEEYAEILAAAIHNYARIYGPEIIIFTGSFAKSADLFLKATQKNLRELLARSKDLIPKIKTSSLRNQAGLLGGAYIAFHRKQ